MMIYIYDNITILKKKIMIREGEEENSKEWVDKRYQSYTIL